MIIAGCTEEKITDVTSGTEPITLSGIVTRADTPRNIYIKAFTPDAPYAYFNETLVNIPAGLNVGDTTAINFSGANPYYPLGETTEIRIFGYSGKAPNDVMTLTAGTSINNDAILSNYGKRKSEPTVNPAYAPLGTPGSSQNPAEILQFRHVMTQLNVNVVVSTNETPQVDPVPTSVRFTLPGVAATGRYGIRSPEERTAVQPTGTYTIQLGTNYLVPTGDRLDGVQLGSLIIDDYTATSTDLQGFTIQPETAGEEMLLMPGYSYNLTFTVSRLRVQSITLSRTNWIPHEVTSNVQPQTYPLQLFLEHYNNSGDNLVNRIVLQTSDRTYVGDVSEDGMYQFITLPGTTEIMNASLFTKNGLLLESNAFTYYNNSNASLYFPTSVGGMLLASPYDPYNATTNPYLVTTPAQFMNVGMDLTVSYRQMNTIDLRTLNLVDENRIFNGFGPFSGIYDGNGKRIDGIDIESQGLFASNSGTLRGIRVTTGTIDGTGQPTAGSICGVNTGTIVGCINEARLITTATGTEILGGICGTNSGQIIGCLNTGTILNGTTVGGICGYNQNTAAGAIIACINTGMMNPQAVDLGFIVGRSEDSNNDVVRSSFSLVGTAQRIIGGPETVVGTGTVGIGQSASLEPEALRGRLPEIPIQTMLQTAMNGTTWGATYQFSFDHAVTSVTWPAPIVQTTP